MNGTFLTGRYSPRWTSAVSCPLSARASASVRAAFAKALEQIVQRKAETLFQKAFANGCPLARKLESKIEAGLQRFFEEGIRWEKKTPGFKN